MMDRSLLWGAFAVGLAGWLIAILLPASEKSSKPPGSAFPKLTWIIAAVLPPLIFLASLPTKPPFSEGHGLGLGFLIGSIAALLAAVAVDRIVQYPSERSGTFATAAPMFLAATAVSVSLLLLWPNIIDTLVGVAIGWLSITVVLVVGSLGRWDAERSPALPLSPSPALLNGAAFVISLCATAALGVYKGQTAYDHHRWAALSMAIGASIPLLLTLTALPMAFFGRITLKLPLAGVVWKLAARLFQTDDATRAAAGLARIAIAGGLILGLGKLLSVKLVEQPHIWHVLAVGLVIPLIAWWLISESPNTQYPTPDTHTPPHSHIALLLTASGFMAIFPLLTGFGIGLAILAGWLIVGIAQSGTSAGETSARQIALREFLTRLLVFGTIVLLFRLFSTRFTDDIRGVGLADQYALFGLIAGAALPSIAANVMEKSGNSDISRLFRLGICAAIILTAPGLMILLWGSKCAIAMIFGLALAVGLGYTQTPNHSITQSLNSLFALAGVLTLTQWLHIALPLASMTRAHKVQTVTWAVAGLIAIVFVSEFVRRFRSTESSTGMGATKQ